MPDRGHAEPIRLQSGNVGSESSLPVNVAFIWVGFESFGGESLDCTGSWLSAYLSSVALYSIECQGVDKATVPI